MSKNYIHVDLANTFFRARHAIKGDADTKIGMSLHIVFHSIKKAWTDFKGDHVIFHFEGRSWRKDAYTRYKKNRADARASLTPREQEEDKVFWETLDAFKDFVVNKTNCSTLHHPCLEADDLIAGFIQTHPNDNHVIVSSDSDFVQLLGPNVKIYNGITENLFTHEGIFDKKNKKLSFVIKSNSKIQAGKADPNFEPPADWIEFTLFLKCIRGDTSDNVFSAYPNAPLKSTKNRVGIQEAFNDRDKKGWAWNNFMLQRWTDHNNEEHRVFDDYRRNRQLIDLTAQPEEIRQVIKETIENSVGQKEISQVGIRLLKFCQLYNLQKISEQAQHYAEPLNAKYIKEVI